MEWLTALAVVTIVAGITITVVVLLAVRALRHSLQENALRQAQQLRRLAESVAALHQQQQSAHQRIQALAEADRRLAQDVVALAERVADGNEGEVGVGALTVPRLLN